MIYGICLSFDLHYINGYGYFRVDSVNVYVSKWGRPGVRARRKEAERKHIRNFPPKLSNDVCCRRGPRTRSNISKTLRGVL